MSLFTIFLIAFALALDAFAVSVSAGLTLKKINILKALSLAFTFGLFQAIMPVIGWLGGVSVKVYIESYDHWIAFVLLGIIGINMISEALGKDEDEKRDYFRLSALLTLGVATSIDALIIGVSFALLPIKIVSSMMIIGLVTFALCLLGVTIGNRFGHIFEKKSGDRMRSYTYPYRHKDTYRTSLFSVDMKRKKLHSFLAILLFIFAFLFFFYQGNDKVPEKVFLTFEAKNGFDILFNPLAEKELKEYYQTGTIVINGSYFGKTQTGNFYPAGIWSIKGQKYFQELIDTTDPNLSHVVLYDHEGGWVILLNRNDTLPDCALRGTGTSIECSTFQAGPLVLSGGKINDFTASWHANEPHERTLLGTTDEGKIYFFLFPEKVTLKEAGESILSKFKNDSLNLINLDGGPSTGYFDGEKGFGQNKKLPIILRINL